VPNFGQGADVEVYNSSFQKMSLAGAFADPNVPAGYAPYAVKSIGTQVYVAYMLRTTPPFAPGAGSYQEIFGTGNGFVSVFDVNGNYLARAVTGGNLNAPWGITIAPAGFGIYGGDLLIGNFADGLITAYNPTTYAYLGVVADGTGKPIANAGLWAIFVSTATAAIPNSIYFTAGPDGETHGLFGAITSGAPTTGTQTFNVSASLPVTSVAVGAAAAMSISVAPSNAFSGTVSLSCSGLPASATCVFGSPQLAVTSSAPAITTLSIQTSTGTAGSGYARASSAGFGGGLLALLPAAMLAVVGVRRRRFARVSMMVALLVGAMGLVAGCATSAGTPATPAGMSTVMVTATSGSVTQTTAITLTVH